MNKNSDEIEVITIESDEEKMTADEEASVPSGSRKRGRPPKRGCKKRGRKAAPPPPKKTPPPKRTPPPPMITAPPPQNSCTAATQTPLDGESMSEQEKEAILKRFNDEFTENAAYQRVAAAQRECAIRMKQTAERLGVLPGPSAPRAVAGRSGASPCSGRRAAAAGPSGPGAVADPGAAAHCSGPGAATAPRCSGPGAAASARCSGPGAAAATRCSGPGAAAAARCSGPGAAAAARCSDPGAAARCSSPGAAASTRSSPGAAASTRSSPGAAAATRCSSPGAAASTRSSPGAAAATRCSGPGAAAHCSGPGAAAHCSGPGAVAAPRCAARRSGPGAVAGPSSTAGPSGRQSTLVVNINDTEALHRLASELHISFPTTSPLAYFAGQYQFIVQRPAEFLYGCNRSSEISEHHRNCACAEHGVGFTCDICTRENPNDVVTPIVHMRRFGSDPSIRRPSVLKLVRWLFRVRLGEADLQVHDLPDVPIEEAPSFPSSGIPGAGPCSNPDCVIFCECPECEDAVFPFPEACSDCDEVAAGRETPCPKPGHGPCPSIHEDMLRSLHAAQTHVPHNDGDANHHNENIPCSRRGPPGQSRTEAIDFSQRPRPRNTALQNIDLTKVTRSDESEEPDVVNEDLTFGPAQYTAADIILPRKGTTEEDSEFLKVYRTGLKELGPVRRVPEEITVNESSEEEEPNPPPDDDEGSESGSYTGSSGEEDDDRPATDSDDDFLSDDELEMKRKGLPVRTKIVNVENSVKLLKEAAIHFERKYDEKKQSCVKLERKIQSVLDSSVICLICQGTPVIPVVSVACWHVFCQQCWFRSMPEETPLRRSQRKRSQAQAKAIAEENARILKQRTLDLEYLKTKPELLKGLRPKCPKCSAIVVPADLKRLYL